MKRTLATLGAPVVGLRRAPRGELRSPLRVWALTLVSLGLYGLVVHFRVTVELRALTSMTLPAYRFRLPGWAAVVLLVLAGPLEAFSMSARIRRAGMLAGVESRCGSFTGFACWFLGAASAYHQLHLNQIWSHLETLATLRESDAELARSYVRPAARTAPSS